MVGSASLSVAKSLPTPLRIADFRRLVLGYGPLIGSMFYFIALVRLAPAIAGSELMPGSVPATAVTARSRALRAAQVSYRSYRPRLRRRQTGRGAFRHETIGARRLEREPVSITGVKGGHDILL